MIGVVDFLGREFRVRMIFGCSMAHGGDGGESRGQAMEGDVFG